MYAYTGNETEYLATIAALRRFGADRDAMVAYSDLRLSWGCQVDV